MPNIVSDEIKEFNKNYIYSKYNELFKIKDKIDPHTERGWEFRSYTSYKLLSDFFPEIIIDAGFTHNALSININHVKEIYDLIKNKYEYADKILYSKVRTVYDIQFQTFYNSYAFKY